MNLEEPVFSYELDESLPVTIIEGSTSRAAAVPTLYAIRFFCKELELALDTLVQCQELQELLGNRDEEKDEIYECLQRVMQRFQEFLMTDLRR
jgi:hypothetical protein